MKDKNTVRKRMIIVPLCLVLLLALSLAFFKMPILKFLYKDFKAPTPRVSSFWESGDDLIVQGDIYVSKSGSDENDGTKEKPFLTIERALEAVELMDKTEKSQIIVCIMGGKYNIDPFKISEQHGGTENCRVIYSSCGDEEVILNCGLNIDANDFEKVSKYPQIEKRLSAEERENVYVLDLTKAPYGLTQDDWSKLYPIGAYNTADRYAGDTTGAMYSELFINGTRQSLARYPNDGYIYTGAIISEGKSGENKPNGDPMGDTFEVNADLGARIQSWSNIEDVWVYGFWQYDWADGSSPLESFDDETNSLTTKYQSFFGIKENAPFFFYNCPEELDTDNEWYLDRERGLLCVYSSSGLKNAEISMSVSTDTAIYVNSSYVTLNGLNISGTRGGGIFINGNNNIISGCTVSNVGGYAIQAHGLGNVITKNEVYGVGKSGISVVGGNPATLEAGNNVVSNNLIHDWSQVYKTYQAGIGIGGVGNICANNELFNSPHMAITYGGNNHIVEYNLIHDVCLDSDDAGAIYAGKSWSSYGNDIRYNLIYNLGSGEHSPNGIYMDDALSGQSIYENILINIPKYAIFIGGGRDVNVFNNLIINPGDSAIKYDSRARDATLKETWFSNDVDDLWETLQDSNWQSEIWQEAFPEYKDITDDPLRIDDPNYMANPGNSFIGGNIIFDKYASLGSLDEAVYDYSTVSDNKLYYLFQLYGPFKDYKEGNYSIDENALIYKEEFNRVLEQVGRY